MPVNENNWVQGNTPASEGSYRCKISKGNRLTLEYRDSTWWEVYPTTEYTDGGILEYREID